MQDQAEAEHSPSPPWLQLVEPAGAFWLLVALVGAVVLLACGASLLGLVLIAVALAGLVYLRTPTRETQFAPDALLSPVDGVVETVEHGPEQQIVLSCPWTAVRTLRAPADGLMTITNAKRTLRLDTTFGAVLLRIPPAVIWTPAAAVGPQRQVRQGDRLGTLLLGHRIRVRLPENLSARVQPGTPVRAAQVMLADSPDDDS